MNFIQSVFTNAQTKYLSFAHDYPLPASSSSVVFQPVLEYKVNVGWSSYTNRLESSLTTVPASTAASFKLLSWNVDSSAADPRGRLEALIVTLESNKTLAVDVIALQEVFHTAVSALTESAWVRQHFYLTDTDRSHLQDGRAFGSITLLRRDSLWTPHVAYRIALPSHMHRDALCTDLFIQSHAGTIGLRVQNIHLDSLNINPPLRPAQLEVCAAHLRALGRGIAVGDFNAITERDANLAEEVGLQDAWQACHGDAPGHTWGVQVEEPFPPGRLDRATVLGLEVKDVQIVPSGTVGAGYWSDHCELWTSLEVTY